MRAERVPKPERSEAVNNFAAISFEANLRSEHNRRGRKVPGRTRSSYPNPTRIEPRTPVDPGARVKKSERTTPCEGLRIRTTHDQSQGSSAPKPMIEQIPWNKITYYAGFDWAKDHHDVVVVNPQGKIVKDLTFEHSAEGWTQWKELVAAYPGLAVAIETNQGAAIEQLLQSGVAVYPVNPKSAERYRDRKAPSGTKTDYLDSWSLADALRVDGHGWRALKALDPLIHELRLLCRDEVELISKRTELVNQLQAALHEYYPAALEAFEDWTTSPSWSFVQKFPTPELLQKAGRRKWESFLHVHRLYRPELNEKRLQIFAKAHELCGSPAVTRAKSRLALALIKLLNALETQLQDYRKEIQRLFEEHPDHDLFGSLPGAGAKLAPRLLSEVGSDRSLFENAQALQCYVGTAPVSFQSGQVNQVHVRFMCNKSFRYTVHLWADLSRKFCSWAQVYYQQLRAKGKTHATALRCLGQRWLKILWKMWQTQTRYNADLHMANQLKHGSWILKVNAPQPQ
jgi:transposase